MIAIPPKVPSVPHVAIDYSHVHQLESLKREKMHAQHNQQVHKFQTFKHEDWVKLRKEMEYYNQLIDYRIGLKNQWIARKETSEVQVLDRVLGLHLDVYV